MGLKNEEIELYNEKANKKEFDNILSAMGEGDNKLFNALYENMTSFEREMLVKLRLSKIREHYLKEGKEEMEEEDKERAFNGLYFGIQRIVKENRGVNIYVTGNGNVIFD